MKIIISVVCRLPHPWCKWNKLILSNNTWRMFNLFSEVIVKLQGHWTANYCPGQWHKKKKTSQSKNLQLNRTGIFTNGWLCSCPAVNSLTMHSKVICLQPQTAVFCVISLCDCHSPSSSVHHITGNNYKVNMSLSFLTFFASFYNRWN